MPFDIAAVLLGGREGASAAPSLRAFGNAILAARAAGLRVQPIVQLDAADEATKALFEGFECDGLIRLSSDFCNRALARNTAVEAVDAQHIALIDAGDIWTFDWLTEAHAYLRAAAPRVIAHPQYSFVLGRARRIVRRPNQDSFECDLDLARIAHLWPGQGMSSAATYRAIPFRSDAGYNPDWTWNLDAMAAGYRHKVISQTVVFQRDCRAHFPRAHLPVETPVARYDSVIYHPQASAADLPPPTGFDNQASYDDVVLLHSLFLGGSPPDPASIARYQRDGITGFVSNLIRSGEFADRLDAMLDTRSGSDDIDGATDPHLTSWAESRFGLSVIDTSASGAACSVLAALLSMFPFRLIFARAFGDRSANLIMQLRQRATRGAPRWAGCLDHCSHNMIKGWIARIGHHGPVTIAIKVGEQLAGICEATIYRRDVAHTLGINGICGFELVPVVDWNLMLDPAPAVTFHDITTGEQLPLVAELGNQRRTDPFDRHSTLDHSGADSQDVFRIDALLSRHALPAAPLVDGEETQPLLVTVVIQTRELSADELEATIASVARQTHYQIQILLVGTPMDFTLPDAGEGYVPVFVIEAGASDRETIARIVEASDGELLCMLASGGTLDPVAIGWFAYAFRQHGARILYADDISGHRACAQLKPAFDPDLLLQQDYISDQFCVAKADLTAMLAASLSGPSLGRAGAGQYDLLLHLLDQVPEPDVMHIPLMLHRKRRALALSPGEIARQRQLAERALERRNKGESLQPFVPHPRLGLPARHYPCSPAPIPRQKLAIIIPTRDRAELLQPCIDSLQRMMVDPASCEIVIVDNGSNEPATFAYFDSVRRRGNVRILRSDSPFNWSGLNNFAVHNCDAELLLFANNDIEVLTEGFDDILRGLLARANVGAVGALLLYPNGAIQHAGTALGVCGVPHHIAAGRMPADTGIASIANYQRSVSAVTGAFLAISRSTFEEVGGFDDVNLKIAFSDVDLCMKVTVADLRVIYTPHIACLHHESASRGLDGLDPEKQARAEAEILSLKERWGSLLGSDPWHNIVYERYAEPFTMARIPNRPAVLEALLRQMPRGRKKQGEGSVP